MKTQDSSQPTSDNQLKALTKQMTDLTALVANHIAPGTPSPPDPHEEPQEVNTVSSTNFQSRGKLTAPPKPAPTLRNNPRYRSPQPLPQGVKQMPSSLSTPLPSRAPSLSYDDQVMTDLSTSSSTNTQNTMFKNQMQELLKLKEAQQKKTDPPDRSDSTRRKYPEYADHVDSLRDPAAFYRQKMQEEKRSRDLSRDNRSRKDQYSSEKRRNDGRNRERERRSHSRQNSFEKNRNYDSDPGPQEPKQPKRENPRPRSDSATDHRSHSRSRPPSTDYESRRRKRSPSRPSSSATTSDYKSQKPSSSSSINRPRSRSSERHKGSRPSSNHYSGGYHDPYKERTSRRPDRRDDSRSDQKSRSSNRDYYKSDRQSDHRSSSTRRRSRDQDHHRPPSQHQTKTPQSVPSNTNHTNSASANSPIINANHDSTINITREVAAGMCMLCNIPHKSVSECPTLAHITLNLLSNPGN